MPDPTRTDAALGVLVGATPEAAVAAAGRVADDWPGLGLLVAGAVAAARWGVDLVPAIQRLADAEPLRGSTSDYEIRFAVEEASDDLDRALDLLTARLWDVVDTGVVLLPADDAEMAAAVGAVEGRKAWRLDSDTEDVTRVRVASLAQRLGIHLVTEGHGPVAQEAESEDDRDTGVLVGWDRLLRT